jgi:hypothetical protein
VIRHFDFNEIEKAREIHKANGLDERCFPDLEVKTERGEIVPNPLFVVKEVFEHEGAPVLMSFLKITSELYLLVDHTVGTPEERWEWLKAFKEHMKVEAWRLGLDQMTAWIPSDIEKSFADRLEEMGFIKSPWQSWTLNIENE